jgi:hypothetical protein
VTQWGELVKSVTVGVIMERGWRSRWARGLLVHRDGSAKSPIRDWCDD